MNCYRSERGGIPAGIPPAFSPASLPPPPLPAAVARVYCQKNMQETQERGEITRAFENGRLCLRCWRRNDRLRAIASCRLFYTDAGSIPRRPFRPIPDSIELNRSGTRRLPPGPPATGRPPPAGWPPNDVDPGHVNFVSNEPSRMIGPRSSKSPRSNFVGIEPGMMTHFQGHRSPALLSSNSLCKLKRSASISGR